MSLCVDVFVRDAAGEMELISLVGPGRDLAGFESFRKTFYGGKTARSLGLKLLPSLSDEDLYCEGDDLIRLQNEARIILLHINDFTLEANADTDCLQFRIQNILAAVDLALELKGGVVIW